MKEKAIMWRLTYAEWKEPVEKTSKIREMGNG